MNEEIKTDDGIRDQEKFLNPKFTLDISFLLATVIAGQAIIESIVRYCDGLGTGNIDIILLAQAATVILTTLRFFNGNVMWNYVNFHQPDTDISLNLRQRAFRRLSSYFIHILQYVLFYMAARKVGDLIGLVKFLIFVSAVDVVWTFMGWMECRIGILRKALTSWCFLNLGTLILSIVYLGIGSKYDSFLNDKQLGYFLFLLYALAALLDYLINIELYFGYSKRMKK
ncbi:MAG: hypothetical protein KOO63_11680 [Bacteroidales bacterium]|nr:hypothetical protein [Candidatus Latescibacterota bacterium]